MLCIHEQRLERFSALLHFWSQIETVKSKVDEAEEACKEIDMHLVSILDHEENQAVLDLVRRNNVSFILGFKVKRFLAVPYFLTFCESLDRNWKLGIHFIRYNRCCGMRIHEHLPWYAHTIHNNILQESNVWIGLTREVPDPIGTWKWTLPGDSSFSYSNWDHGLCELFFFL